MRSLFTVVTSQLYILTECMHASAGTAGATIGAVPPDAPSAGVLA